MVSLRTRAVLVFGGLAVLAVSAIAAVSMGADEWAKGLLGAQILFAGVSLFLACRCIHRQLDALKRQIETGQPVSVNGECADLGQTIGKMIAAHQTTLAARQQHLSVALDAEARTRQSAQALIDALPHGVALLSPTGRVDLVNARAAGFGLERDKPAEHVPHEWLRALVARTIASRQRTGLADGAAEKPGGTKCAGHCREGLVQIFEEGREEFFLPQGYPLIDDRGEMTGLVLTLVDVTAAHQADEARANLLASLSHEIRTPMTSLQMSIYLLLDDAASRLTPRQLELLSAARDDADRLHRIVEGVLARPMA